MAIDNPLIILRGDRSINDVAKSSNGTVSTFTVARYEKFPTLSGLGVDERVTLGVLVQIGKALGYVVKLKLGSYEVDLHQYEPVPDQDHEEPIK